MKEEYHAHKVKPLLKIAVGIIKNNPLALEDLDYLYAQMQIAIPKLCDKTHCINCGAGMAEYTFEMSVLDGLLLQAMARSIKQSVSDGMPFTEANAVHVPTLHISNTLRNRTTYASKLGLIAKHIGPNDKQIHGQWVITTRGWSALRGEQVPAYVKVFRGKILERTEETTSLAEIFNSYSERARSARMKQKIAGTEHVAEVDTYDYNEWVHVADYNQKTLI